MASTGERQTAPAGADELERGPPVGGAEARTRVASASGGRSRVWLLAPGTTAARVEAVLGGLAARGVTATARTTSSGHAVVVPLSGAEPPAAPPDVVRTSLVEVAGPAAVVRRTLLDGFALALSLGFLGFLGLVALAFLSAPEGGPIRVEQADAGSAAELERAGTLAFRFGREPGVVVRQGGATYAVSAICPNHGCLVEWDTVREEFFCAHARYAPDGSVRAGPSRPLTAFPVSLEKDRLVVRRRVYQ
jgi:nitrite reductase/ring-hydroxylating ferredoxin subunit